MSVHRSLIPKNTLKRSRNVLTRAERVQKLKEEGRWREERSVFGLPKVSTLKKKKKSKAKKVVEGTEGATTETAEKTET